MGSLLAVISLTKEITFHTHTQGFAPEFPASQFEKCDYSVYAVRFGSTFATIQ